jgi:hypothetical protein
MHYWGRFGMRWRKWLMAAASLVLLLSSTGSAQAWFYNPWFYNYNSYYYYGACPDWYWSRGLLWPWSLCPWGGCGYGYGNGYGWGAASNCCYGYPNYSFCPNPPTNYLVSENEVELGGYQAAPYVRVLGSRVGMVAGPVPATPASLRPR